MVHPGGGGVVCPMVHLVGCKADPLRARHPLVGTPHSSRQTLPMVHPGGGGCDLFHGPACGV